MKKSFCTFVLLSLLLLTIAGGEYSQAKKVTTKLKAVAPKESLEKKAGKIRPSDSETFDSITDKVYFLAYDKKASSAKETFFVDNCSDTDLTSIEIEIAYFNMRGKQIHKRKIELKDTFPAHETRKADINSWDTQKSFHYTNSAPSSKGSTAYTVKFRVLSFKIPKLSESAK